MTRSRRVNIESERRKRELRRRLARSRRRIDADVRSVGRSALDGLAWTARVRRHPLATVGVAAGVGVGLSLLPSAGRLVQSAGRGWFTRLTSYAVLRIVVRALRSWRASGSEGCAQEEDE